MAKSYTVIQHRRGRQTPYSGTMPELIKTFAYTLDTGRSYEHESGNSKINTNPKSGKSLVTNLNKAVTNAAANGCPENNYTLAE